MFRRYFEAASKAGLMPNWTAVVQAGGKRGSSGIAATVIPTFTNPNNVAIMCGNTPAENGICGNYFFDQESQQEVMMTDPKYLRSDSIFAKLHKATGTKVTVVTAKDKLLRLLSAGLPADSPGALAVSVEKAAEPEAKALLASHGVPDLVALMGRAPPHIYDPDISIYCLELGLKLLQRDLKNASQSEVPLLYYLSTTDYVQHKYEPGSPEANIFFASVDHVLGELGASGAVVGLTADHGMNGKTGFDGRPRVVYAESVLRNAGFATARVILPITDPYVAHHGSLGSYATVYLSEQDREPARLAQALSVLRQCDGVYQVYGREDAARLFELPADRIGDMVILAEESSVVGRTPEFHDLSQVPNLRSHGGLTENTVPFWINQPLAMDYAKRLTTGNTRNFHLFDFLLNGVAPLPLK